MTELQELKEHFKKNKWEVKRKAKGKIPHDYLVPSGPYEEQWDWDAFFIGMSLASEIPSEAIYLKNWTRNYLAFVEEDGFTPGLLTPEGIDTRLKHIKPFLAQGAFHASKFLGDFSWLSEHIEQIEKVITYRQKKYWSEEMNLSCWFDSMESGADNNIASLHHDDGTVISVDINAFLYLEFKALAHISKELERTEQYEKYLAEADKIKDAINKHLWSEEDGSYYNYDLKTNELIKRDTYSNFITLFAGIASEEQAKELIEKYLINPEKMWGDYGIRTLAKDDEDYNNANIIKPHSNWQGPVWPIANYLYLQGLIRYGYQEKALELAEKITSICLKDIKESDGMHENYDAETGEALAAPNFVSWNLLTEHMHEHAKSGFNPFNIA